MGKLRGILFVVAYYVMIIFYLIILLPTLILPQRFMFAGQYCYLITLRAFIRVILGVKMVVRGAEKLPSGPVLIASKHQSEWETYLTCLIFDRPALVLKEELMRIPLFGWYMSKLGFIPIVRGSGMEALRRMKLSAARVIAQGRPILIYPEGTRMRPGAEPAYKSGVAHLYREFGLPCVPLALNSGLYRPKKGIPVGGGDLVFQICETIPAGEPPRVFRTLVQERVEAACDQLLLEAAEKGWGSLGPLGEARVKALKAAG